MRILLVEDEPDLGNAVQRFLKQNNYIVDWLKNGQEAWDYLESNAELYTVAVLDWLLPGISGLELVQKLRAKQSGLPILMLTAKDTLADRVTGLEAGADDYLIKPFGMTELLARLKALQRRSPQLLPQQLQYGSLSLDYQTYQVFYSHPSGELRPIPLTHKEFQLLEYFMRHPQQIITREQLLSQLWSWESEPISNVVAAQVRLLRRKLAVFGGENYLQTLHGLGYRFAKP